MTKFLIIGPAWIGDMVMAQGLFMSLKQQHAKAKIDVIAPDWTRPLLERMSEVDKILPLPFKHGEFSLKKRWDLGKSLRAENYDEAIVLPNSWKSAIIPYAAGIPKRTGWRGEMRFGLLNNMLSLNKKKYPLMIERFTALGNSSSIEKIKFSFPRLMVNPDLQKAALQKYHLYPGKPVIALCPGAEFGASKRWPETYYAQTAQYLLDKNFNVWLMGSLNDKVITDHIQALTQHRCENLAGRTSLSEAIDLLSLVSLVITNDSGLMHIAAALGKPLIALYGSTDPGFTPPLSDTAKILSINLPCRPCFQRECPLKHHRCMQALLPAQVFQVFEQCMY
jgi:heptosyltransferase-2